MQNKTYKKIRALILDMDGVLWRDNIPIGDLRDIFVRIRNRGLKFAFVTNNASRTPEQYAELLNSYGVKVDQWQILTSALGVAEMLKRDFFVNTTSNPASARIKVFAIGEIGLISALHESGFEVVTIKDASQARAVVMGIDRNISYEKVSVATLLVRSGLPFYATNSDKTFPIPSGEIPGVGSWISVIVSASNIEPTFAGKPEPVLLELACRRLETGESETLVVGDRLETDIKGGQIAGMPVALVLSGVSTREAGEAWMPKIDIICHDLFELTEIINCF